MTRRHLLTVVALALVVGLLGGHAVADKTITQKTVVIGNITRLNIEVLGGVPTARVTYHVVDGSGVKIGNDRVLAVPLTNGQVTTLTNFLNGVILPAVNAAEGTP